MKEIIQPKPKTKMIEFDSYTTQIGLDPDNEPGTEVPTLQIGATEYCYVTMNGLHYCLDEHTFADVKFDASQNIVIVNEASELSCPAFIIKNPRSPGKLYHIYPNANIFEKLRDIKDGDQLKAATTQDGKPVLASQHTDSATAVATALQQVATDEHTGQFVGSKLGTFVYSVPATPPLRAMAASKKITKDCGCDKKPIVFATNDPFFVQFALKKSKSGWSMQQHENVPREYHTKKVTALSVGSFVGDALNFLHIVCLSEIFDFYFIFGLFE
jgi:hypothetical protein